MFEKTVECPICGQPYVVMDGDKVYGLCSLCGGTLLSDHDCIGLRKAFGLPPAVDWHAVARDAAVRLFVECWTTANNSYDAREACDSALALVAEMRKRAEFGGGA